MPRQMVKLFMEKEIRLLNLQSCFLFLEATQWQDVSMSLALLFLLDWEALSPALSLLSFDILLNKK